MADKSKAKKQRLAKLERQNSRIPRWVVLRTDGEVGRQDPEKARNPKRRDWRRDDTDE